MKKLRCIMMGLIVLFAMQGAMAQGSSSSNEEEIMLTSTDINGIYQDHDQILLSDLLSTLEQYFDVTFLYKDEVMANKYVQRDNIKIGKKTGQELARILEELGVTFQRIDEQTYVLLNKDLYMQAAQLQEKISGTVTDGQSGETLPGVNVMVKGTTTGTSTDTEGGFELMVESLQDTLIFSFVGYQTLEMPINGRTELDIALHSQAITGEELVVVGYGEQGVENLTGSVSTVSAEQIEEVNVSTVSQALQGLSPGMTFSYDNNGFEPGATPSINIRGESSLNGGSPLVIIDGFPGDMNKLSPQEIESISILKDAAASAIYGARGSDGVILVTTKSGNNNQELTVNYSGGISIRSANRLPEQPDSYTFAKVMNEMGDNGGDRPYTNESIEQIIAYQNGDIDYLKEMMPEGVIADMPDEDNIKYYQSEPRESGVRFTSNADDQANYDWYDEYYGYSVNQKHNLSLSGGSDNTTYYLNAGYMNQKGILNYGTDTYARYTITGKVRTDLTDWWNFQYETRFYESPREHWNGKRGFQYSGAYRELVRSLPTQAKYTPYGRYANESKINWLTETGTDKWTETENWQILETNLNPIEGWSITANFAYKNNAVNRQDREFTVYEEYVDHSLHANGETVPNSYNKINSNTTYWSANLFSSYEFSTGNHNFYGMLGSQLELNRSNYLNTGKQDLISQDVPSLSIASGDPTTSEDLGHWATEGFFGRFKYNFREKYLLEANARYDGTSRFQKNEKWGFFPSFSAAWNIHQENFWEPIKNYVSSFKIRASWGELGNQQVTPYQDLAFMPLNSGQLNWLFGYGSSLPQGYAGIPNLVSPNLTWENTTTKNIGVDLSFFDRKLQASVDIFEKNNNNMIGPAEPVPGVLGSEPPSANNAGLRTRGWEATLEWRDNINRDFSYFVNFNISDQKTIVTKYNNPSGLISGFYEGKVLGEVWGYTANSLFQSQQEADSYVNEIDMSYIYDSWNAGDIKYEDVNGDGAINPGSNTIDNHGDLSVIGNTRPRYQFGLNIGMNYKAFDLSLLLSGTAKKDVMPGAGDYVYWGVQQYLFIAFTKEHLDYFRDQSGDKYSGLYEGERNINRDAFWPKMYMNASENYKNREPSTRYLADASYIRLRNVQVGYTFTDNIFGDRLGLKDLRLYLSADNLFTHTNLMKGIDPQATHGQLGIGMTKSPDRIITMGLNVTF